MFVRTSVLCYLPRLLANEQRLPVTVPLATAATWRATRSLWDLALPMESGTTLHVLLEIYLKPSTNQEENNHLTLSFF